MTVDPRAISGFTAAEAYDRSRPGYPRAAVDRLLAELRLDRHSRVLDLAAGTGQVSRALRGRVGKLLAVEPGPQMRARFATRLPDVPVREGAAEHLPLPDAGVDAVVVGEAFHWFDTVAAAAEIARVLYPRGGLALLWNRPRWTEDDTPWLARFRDLLAGYRAAAGPYPAGDGRWEATLERTGLFEPVSRAELAHAQQLSVADFVAQVASWSWVANLPDATRTGALADVAALLAGHEVITVRYRTELCWTRRAR